MYWRVRRLTLNELLSRYWMNIALVVSVVLNLLLWTTRPDPNKMGKELKTNYEQFVRNVTTHLLDVSYLNYRDNTNALLSGELTKPVIDMLRTNGVIVGSRGELEEQAKKLYEQKQVCAVRIDQVTLNDNGPSKPITADVTGHLAQHSVDDSREMPFHFYFAMDARHNPDRSLILGPDNRPMPEVIDFKELDVQPGQGP